MPLIEDAAPWHRRSWGALRAMTVGFTAVGFLIGALSHLSGNAISVNGTAIEGWWGVWTVTLAMAAAGFLFGLIWFLVFRALAVAAGGNRR